MSGTDGTPPLLKKQRKSRNVWGVPRYKASAKNKALVAEVLKQKSFFAPYGDLRKAWEKVAAELNKTSLFANFKCNQLGCRSQVKYLLKYWEGKRLVMYLRQLRVSGWDTMLEDLINLHTQAMEEREERKRKKGTPDDETDFHDLKGRVHELMRKRPRLVIIGGKLLKVIETDYLSSVAKTLKDHRDRLPLAESPEDLKSKLTSIKDTVASMLANLEATENTPSAGSTVASPPTEDAPRQDQD